MRRAGTRRRTHTDVTVIDGFCEVRPRSRHGQFLGLQIAGVPHDAVAGSGKAFIVAVRIVDRKSTDLLRNPGHFYLVLLQQVVALEHLEGIRGGGPEHVGNIIACRLLQVLDAGGRFLLQHLDFDTRMLGFKSLLYRDSGIRRIGCDNDKFVLHRLNLERRGENYHRQRHGADKHLAMNCFEHGLTPPNWLIGKL
ncbi:hypothetical protein MnTg02_00165 [bacterium MnTg02]|nr:hypothetical protein MnTg02_00165 [bacterium MnTg02]